LHLSSCSAEHMSGAWAAKFPLTSHIYFITPLIAPLCVPLPRRLNVDHQAERSPSVWHPRSTHTTRHSSAPMLLENVPLFRFLSSFYNESDTWLKTQTAEVSAGQYTAENLCIFGRKRKRLWNRQKSSFSTTKTNTKSNFRRSLVSHNRGMNSKISYTSISYIIYSSVGAVYFLNFQFDRGVLP